MTEQQKAWLDNNPGFRVVGPSPGGFYFTQTAFIAPDGKTYPPPRKATDKPIPHGSFQVGVLTERKVGVPHANGR